tara:strand:- start:52 stop:282 length:231 start_codon:yes stop_codon:yes gene_type:complete
MINKTKEQAKKDMKKYHPDDFKLYCCEAGWESWMEEYTEAKEGEGCTDVESVEIEKIQKELWEDCHKYTRRIWWNW